MTSVLFVCLGNICRSPLAEGVFRHLVGEAGASHDFEIDSAGTGSWHVGQAPDERMSRTASAQGVKLSHQRARQFIQDDLERFDYIFAMDKNNLHDILQLDVDDRFGHKVRLFREFDSEPGSYQVPDPYYGGNNGFEEVFAIVHRTAKVLLCQLMGPESTD